MSTLPPLPALRSFEAVARLGSLTLAAAELHVTHSAVSQQIKLLESLLGVALFLRNGRTLQLSEEGRLYALQIRTGLGELINATRLVRARPREDELVLAVLPSFGLHWLLPRLPRFQALHPEYRLSLRANLDIQDLSQGLVDAGIRIGHGQWDGLQQLHLFDDELRVVAAPHFNQGNLPQTAPQIRDSTLIGSAESWLSWCHAAGVAEAALPPLWINDANLVLEAARLGQGIALLRSSLLDTALATGQLQLLSDIRPAHVYPHWLVWPPRQHAQRKVQDFANWLTAELAAYLASR